LALRTRFRSEDIAFRGDGTDYAGDVLQNQQYANDQAYSRGSYFDHLADFHEPPVIVRGWEVSADASTVGAFQVSAGVGVCLDDTGEAKRIETLAAVEGLLPVDTSAGVKNYIIARWSPVDSTAEQSWLDAHEYAKDRTDGCAITVATSYDSTADVVLGVIFPGAATIANVVMTQPWRSPDLSGPTGKAGGGINLAPNSRLICTTIMGGGIDRPDWWSAHGDNPTACALQTGGVDMPDYLKVKMYDGEGLRLDMPSESVRVITTCQKAVLSFEIKGLSGTDPLIAEVLAEAGGWSILGTTTLYPQYITSLARIALRIPTGGTAWQQYRIVFRNGAGTAGFTEFALANVCINAGDYAPSMPLPSGLYTPETLRFSHSGGLSGPAVYFYGENINGDDFPIETPCYIGRIWVHDRTAASGGDTSIEIRVDGAGIKTCVLPNGATSASFFYGGTSVYRPGKRISVFGTGPIANGPQYPAVTVELLHLAGG